MAHGHGDVRRAAHKALVTPHCEDQIPVKRSWGTCLTRSAVSVILGPLMGVVCHPVLMVSGSVVTVSRSPLLGIFGPPASVSGPALGLLILIANLALALPAV